MPTPMERAPDPQLEFKPIPKQRYTSTDFAQQEWQKMWTKVWLMAGRESDIPNEGDYFSYDIGSESILIIRQRDGTLAARYNVCMHRGNRLCDHGIGNAQRFFCKFHGWQYDIDGSLKKALDPDKFPQGLPEEQLKLQPVKCDTWAGFIFISLNPDIDSLGDYLGVIPEHLDPYHFENWKVDFDCSIEIDCNWKTSVDAFNEAYHIAATHTWTMAFSDDVNTTYDCYDKHTRMIFPEVQASPRHKGSGTVTEQIKEMFLQRVGIDSENFDGSPAEARTAFAEAIKAFGPSVGADFSELNEAQMCDDFHYTLFPNVTFNTHSMFVWVFMHRPHPTDPNKMLFDFINLTNTPAVDVKRPKRLFLKATPDFKIGDVLPGGEVLDEDLYNLPRVQAGMNSSAFKHLHLNAQEIRILHFHDTLMSYIEMDDKDAPG